MGGFVFEDKKRVLKKRVYDPLLNHHIDVNEISLLCSVDKGKQKGQILFTATVIYVNKRSKNSKSQTVYFSPGGTSYPSGLTNILASYRLFSKFSNINKIVIFSHPNAYIRTLDNMDLISSDILLSSITELKIPELQPVGTPILAAFSTGTGPILKLTCLMQSSEEYLKNFPTPQKLILMEPVGILPIHNIVPKLAFTPIKSFFCYLKRGCGIMEAMARAYIEVSEAWVSKTKPTSSFLDISRDILFSDKKGHLEESEYFGIKKFHQFFPPYKDYSSGKYRKYAEKIDKDIQIDLLFATDGYDPIIGKIRRKKSRINLYTPFETAKDIEKVLYKFRLIDVYSRVFKKVPLRKTHAAYIIGAHSLFMSPIFVEEILRSLSHAK